MTIHRFFLPSECFQKDKVLIMEKELCHQMVNVLRLKIGENVVLLDNQGFEYESEIKSLNKNLVQFDVLLKKKNGNEAKYDVFLYQAITKKLETFELIAQKATELGVKGIFPLVTERTLRDFLPKKDRLEKIMKEASEQSERGFIPLLFDPIKFEDAVEKVSKDKNVLNLFCYERENSPLTPQPLSHSLKREGQGENFGINIFIGPEGGFSDKEVNLVKSCSEKFQIISLGKRILRTETAAIVALAKVLV
ncbi:MAG: hypothetical protein UR28_C0012G0039 [Candidatus Peregrinibacteria bacterium GW2011_GWF2_33_10]|nr:MAG: hypothetical protein UR28_C0012G0039 [Candidatus Peregrinibacteria bacterium GW2011_GWF2_33_10]OGJ44059.1 MAG: hypothetical protein A2263_01485 [Candidatus Peregrinibacteria bacterium RIFOXYA2_FULL_33_21]OGJ45704.1 MAG: hypothetical protein A2272_03780 [Candidatus Peregrinibacteria bacterium RIFOXYA12_FULL_33_12]OGJ51416.1 MAG: hypothetical protein A2307_02620 [Candidatus Peregrinibacteria bacterium RIFOXYB2_FULL_33_20]